MKREWFGVLVCGFALLWIPAARADVTLPTMNYVGAFFTPSGFNVGGNRGQWYGGIAYYPGDPTYGERVYISDFTRLAAISVPELKDPGVVGWADDGSGINIAGSLIGRTTIGSYNNRGLMIHDPGTGPQLYSVGHGNPEYSTVDLGLAANVDNSTLISNSSALSPVPTGFSVAAGGDAGMNTLLNRQEWFASPQIYVMSADGAASTEVFRFANNPLDDGWVGGSWQAIEWIQPPGTTDWEDGFVVLTECVGGTASTAPTSLSMVFFDPVELAALGAGSRPNPADSLTPAQMTRVDILPLMSPGVGGTGALIGLSYDPATGNLYGLENTATGPGPGVVHVWNLPIPEPATMSLLLLGAIPMLRRRFRRK